MESGHGMLQSCPFPGLVDHVPHSHSTNTTLARKVSRLLPTSQIQEAEILMGLACACPVSVALSGTTAGDAVSCAAVRNQSSSGGAWALHRGPLWLFEEQVPLSSWGSPATFSDSAITIFSFETSSHFLLSSAFPLFLVPMEKRMFKHE